MRKQRLNLYIDSDLKDKLELAFKRRESIKNFEGVAYDSLNKLSGRLLRFALDNLESK